MTANVIQHTKPRRKRGGAWSWTMRHILLLAVVMTGIIAASWLAPGVGSRPTAKAPSLPQQTAAPALPQPTPDLTAVDATADLASRPAPIRRVRQTERRTGIPLDAAVTPTDDYEILSAAELDDISQARR